MILALRLLREKFGRPEKVIELYTELQAIPKYSNKFADIKCTSDSIEKILHQLEAQNEPVNSQMMLIQQLLSKFPADFLLKLEQTKEPTVPWTMKKLILFVKSAYRKIFHALYQAQMHMGKVSMSMIMLTRLKGTRLITTSKNTCKNPLQRCSVVLVLTRVKQIQITMVTLVTQEVFK